mmetsp:Transcript_6182/g.7506  ORF Transcript_6182/g.7506 Transcript_6182/m.7506 type:complete len:140 (+) Transcript_6182:3-422(+)
MLERACKSHSHRIAEARKGRGVDRHLFALHQCARENNIGSIPSLLQASDKNALLQKASCWDLSTSHVTSPNCSKLDHGIAFHPVGLDSIGIVYSMYGTRIDFTIMYDARSELVSGKHFLETVFHSFYDLVYLITEQPKL